MTANPVRNIVIVGGGTAGWMAAAAIAKILGTVDRNVTLVESEEIGTVGVGEATIPAIILFNQMLGIDEDEFVRETHATFKLGIDFVNWRRLDHRYFHQFGLIGAELKNGVSFTHYWMRWRDMGGEPEPLQFSAETVAAKEGRFGKATPKAGRNVPNVNYAYQFDAATYAAFLRRFAESLGIVRKEGKVVDVELNSESGMIEAVKLGDGSRIEGELFIDCSGFGGLLIEQTLKSGFEDWSHWLPNDRAVAVPCAKIADPSPFTTSTAQESGWQWRIPLQHRTGNGYVFSSRFISEDEATANLLKRLDGEPLAEPKLLKFQAGKRKQAWIKNCIALGLSSGFLEPLESTSIHLIQVGIMRLFAFFPEMDFDPLLAKRYNDEMDLLYDGIRDFIIAHYKVTERDDTPYWDYCRTMDIPDSLKARLDLFAMRGEVVPDPRMLFTEGSWFAVLYGQGLEPRGYHPVADALPADQLVANLTQIRSLIRQRVDELPMHGDYLRQIAAGARPNAFA
ncbi:MAG: tryptophan halogenase family protein [Sphingomicrobium sp.]